MGTALAGCSSDDGEDDEEEDTPRDNDDTPDGTDPSTDTRPGSSLRLAAQDKDIDIAWNRKLDNIQELPEDQVVDIKVVPKGDVSMDDVDLMLEHGEGEDAVKKKLEPGKNGKTKIPATELMPGKTRVYATTGELESNTETITKEVPGSFIVDLHDQHSWDTPYAFDDFDYSHQRIWSHRMKWNQQQAYNDMIQTLNTEGKKEKYSDEWTAITYPDDIDTWSRSTFRNQKDIHDLLQYASTATQIKQYVIEGIDNRSRENDAFSATLERLVNKVHSEEDYKRKITTTHVNQVGHGTCIAYAHTDETDLEGDNNWWFVDTTWKTVQPIDSDTLTIHDGYNPFVQGYTGDSDEELGYETEKEIANASLQSFITRSNNASDMQGIEIEDFENFSLSDPMLEHVYNQHILENDGDVEPVLDTVEKAVDYQMQTDQPVTIIGDNWDNLEYGTGEELHQASMNPDVRLTKEKAYELAKETQSV